VSGSIIYHPNIRNELTDLSVESIGVYPVAVPGQKNWVGYPGLDGWRAARNNDSPIVLIAPPLGFSQSTYNYLSILNYGLGDPELGGLKTQTGWAKPTKPY